nr:unnamed protein product [Callosobruchus analis]
MEDFFKQSVLVSKEKFRCRARCHTYVNAIELRNCIHNHEPNVDFYKKMEEVKLREPSTSMWATSTQKSFVIPMTIKFNKDLSTKRLGYSRCRAKLITRGGVVEVHGEHNHESLPSIPPNCKPQKVTIVRKS